jgi:hypothetical protein
MLAQNKPFSFKISMDKVIVKEHGMNSLFRCGVRQTITAVIGCCTTITVFYITARTTKRTLLMHFPRSLLLKGVNKKYLR